MGVVLPSEDPSEGFHFCLKIPLPLLRTIHFCSRTPTIISLSWGLTTTFMPISFLSSKLNHSLVSADSSTDPIELQVSAGCNVYPGNASESFLQVAYQGEHIVSFQGTSWQKAPEAPPWLELPIKVINSDQGTREDIQQLLNDTCPQFAHGLLEAGKTDLGKQGQPAGFTLALHLDPFRFSHNCQLLRKGQA